MRSLPGSRPRIITGPLFRRIRGAATVAEPLSAEAVALIVKRRALLARLCSRDEIRLLERHRSA